MEMTTDDGGTRESDSRMWHNDSSVIELMYGEASWRVRWLLRPLMSYEFAHQLP